MEKKEIVIGLLGLAVLIFGVVFLFKNTSSDIWVGLIAGCTALIYLSHAMNDLCRNAHQVALEIATWTDSQCNLLGMAT